MAPKNKHLSDHVRHRRKAREENKKPFSDQFIRCVECTSDFIWTEREQQFFKEKGFKNPPKRCRGCRGQARSERGEA
jgi:hypothetical protein